jgi:hypothetical protein
MPAAGNGSFFLFVSAKKIGEVQIEIIDMGLN